MRLLNPEFAERFELNDDWFEIIFGKDEHNTKSTVGTNMGANTVNHELSSKKWSSSLEIF